MGYRRVEASATRLWTLESQTLDFTRLALRPVRELYARHDSLLQHLNESDTIRPDWTVIQLVVRSLRHT
jgi:hypothetical protein